MALVKGTDFKQLTDENLLFAHYMLHHNYALYMRDEMFIDRQSNHWDKIDFFKAHDSIMSVMRTRGFNHTDHDELDILDTPKEGFSLSELMSASSNTIANDKYQNITINITPSEVVKMKKDKTSHHDCPPGKVMRGGRCVDDDNYKADRDNSPFNSTDECIQHWVDQGYTENEAEQFCDEWAKELQSQMKEKEKNARVAYPDEGAKYAIKVMFAGKKTVHQFGVQFGDKVNVSNILSMPKNVEVPVITNKAEAIKYVSDIDWQWPKEGVRALIGKETEEGMDWFEKEGVGEEDSYTITVETGTIDTGTLKEDFKEYFMGDNRIIFRHIEQKSKELNTIGFLISWLTKDTAPYVLSQRAVDKDSIPPEGHSGLPKAMESEIPKVVRWWEAADKNERLKLRKQYLEKGGVKLSLYEELGENVFKAFCRVGNTFVVEASQGFKIGDTIDVLDAEKVIKLKQIPVKDMFNVIKHWWKGPFLANGPVAEHIDLTIGNKMFVINTTSDKMSQNSFEVRERKPYIKDWGKISEITSLSTGTPGNNTASTPAWAQSIDSGEVEIVEVTDKFISFNFAGQMLKGQYILTRENNSTQKWKMEKVGVKKEKLSSDKKNEKSKLSFDYANLEMRDGKMWVTGVAMAEGVWTGMSGISKYWPPHAVAQVAEHLEGKPIGIWSHDEWINVGEVTRTYMQDDLVFFIGRVDDEKYFDDMRSDELAGFSIEADLITQYPQAIVEQVTGVDRVVAVPNPACKVCLKDQVLCDMNG